MKILVFLAAVGTVVTRQGCWEITGELQGHKLSFVVETVDLVKDVKYHITNSSSTQQSCAA